MASDTGNPGTPGRLVDTANGSADLKRWVLGYGKGAKVLEPPELVKLVRDEAEQMNYNYSKFLNQYNGTTKE